MNIISNFDEQINERFLIKQNGQLIIGYECNNRVEAEKACDLFGAGCQIVTWLEGIRDDLIEKGWRCIPVGYVDGNLQPLAKYIDGQSYPSNAQQWKRATALAVALPDDYLLFDWDGYKEGAATVEQISDGLGLTVEELNYAKVQERIGGSSVHWVFRLQTAESIKASTHEWLPSVDIKPGSRRGLVYIKQGKAVTFPTKDDVVQLNLSCVSRPLPMLSMGSPRTCAPERFVTEATPAGLKLLDNIIKELAECAEGGRNDALNVAAVRLGHYVTGGELPEELIKTRLFDTAKVIGLPDREAAATVQSGLKRGKLEPQRLSASIAADVFAQPIALPTAGSDYLPFEKLAVHPIQLVNDHLTDATIMIKSSFDRLATFEEAPYWWNGREWQNVDTALLRRYVGKVMAGDSTVKVSKSRIDSTMSVMLDHAQRLNCINPASDLVFFRNGSFNPETAILSPHDPANFNNRTLSVDYNPVAVAPTWQNWLADIFQNEHERITLLQEIMGWCLCRGNLGIEKAIIMIGPTRSGKGTIIRIMQNLLQAAAGVFHLLQLDAGKVLASMRNCNVAIDPDSASPAKINARQIVGLFKSITANEPISVQLLYTQKTWQGSLDCKLLLAANSLPTMWDDSTATANRWIPLIFDRSFLGEEDPTLASRLIAESQGIATWALKGLQRLMAQRCFTLPESTGNEINNMVQGGSPVEQFIDDCLIFGSEYRISESVIWTVYQSWITMTEHERMNRTHLMKALEDATRGKGVMRKKSLRIENKDRRGFDGLAIADAYYTL